jgi:HxlR-like helix-turn-helix
MHGYPGGMRSYGQYCSVAKALDVIGDRWTLLIARELLLQGPCRYTDLKNGLPGVATNLLAQRLDQLEAAGIVRREEAVAAGPRPRRPPSPHPRPALGVPHPGTGHGPGPEDHRRPRHPAPPHPGWVMSRRPAGR